MTPVRNTKPSVSCGDTSESAINSQVGLTSIDKLLCSKRSGAHSNACMIYTMNNYVYVNWLYLFSHVCSTDTSEMRNVQNIWKRWLCSYGCMASDKIISIDIIAWLYVNKSKLFYNFCWWSFGSRYFCSCYHDITETSWWARRRHQSHAYRLFAHVFVQTQIKENIKSPRHWLLWGEFTGGQRILRTKDQ